MIGQIQAAQQSKSGKTLRVQINNVWYSTKAPELANMVGQEIVFEASRQDFPDGGHCDWLNDYQPSNQSTTPAGQAMSTAMQTNPQPAQSPSAPNKDAVISALALCKCCVPVDAEQAFANFQFLYHKFEAWDHQVPF